MIEVLSSREMLIPCIHIGTVGENNATVLDFEFPASIADYEKSLIVENSSGSYKIDIVENRATMSSVVTGIEDAIIQIVATKDSTIWKSKPYNVSFYSALPDGLPVIDWEKVLNDYREELIQALNNKFNAGLSENTTFDEIISFVVGYEDRETWEWFINLLSNNGYSVNSNMSRDDVDMIVSTFHGETNALLSDYNNFVNRIYETIKNNVDPDIEEYTDVSFASIMYVSALENYFSTHIPESELETLQQTVSELQDERQLIIDSMYNLYTGGFENA